MIAPALRQGSDGDGAPHRLDVALASRVQPADVGDSDAVLVTRDQLELVPRADLAFALHGEVEPGPPAGHKLLEDVRAPELDAEFVAGQARLGDGHFRRADAE